MPMYDVAVIFSGTVVDRRTIESSSKKAAKVLVSREIDFQIELNSDDREDERQRAFQ